MRRRNFIVLTIILLLAACEAGTETAVERPAASVVATKAAPTAASQPLNPTAAPTATAAALTPHLAAGGAATTESPLSEETAVPPSPEASLEAEIQGLAASTDAVAETAVVSGRTPDGAFFMGAPDAPVTIIEYSDFL